MKGEVSKFAGAGKVEEGLKSAHRKNNFEGYHRLTSNQDSVRAGGSWTGDYDKAGTAREGPRSGTRCQGWRMYAAEGCAAATVRTVVSGAGHARAGRAAGGHGIPSSAAVQCTVWTTRGALEYKRKPERYAIHIGMVLEPRDVRLELGGWEFAEQQWMELRETLETWWEEFQEGRESSAGGCGDRAYGKKGRVKAAMRNLHVWMVLRQRRAGEEYRTARCGTCASGDARWIDRDEGICGGQEREPWQRREGTDLRFNAEVRENEGNRRENARKDWSSRGEPNTDEQVRESREMARIGAKVDSRGTVRECGPVGSRLRISERSAGRGGIGTCGRSFGCGAAKMEVELCAAHALHWNTLLRASEKGIRRDLSSGKFQGMI
ncbi:hypothetical protein B0H17DRAFT_1280775 [Mycena rosella]|uniref:Uncharacterized protein n=1 Tax=Mycena rosella TaxID=1033263 RepID=A0AAD7GG21_MYCRO|nr:hypothetical protein B0H17DRAFT_1280775 [Mycena rosella]